MWVRSMPREVDANGWMQVIGNPITKVGVFDYLGSEINAPIPDKIYRVYRPAEELQRQETLDSFKLLPFIDEHTPLGAFGIPAEQKGIQGMIGEQVYFDAPYVRGNIKVLSSAAMAQIGAGKIELSPGYNCKYDFTPGVFDGQAYDAIQRDISGNHLALVMEGRTGPDVAVQDSKLKQIITIDTAELLPMEFTPEQLEQLKAMITEIVAAMTAPNPTGDADPVNPAAADADPSAEPVADADAVVDPNAVVEPVVSAAEGTAAEEAVAVAEEAQAALEEAMTAIEEVTAATEEVVAAADAKSKKMAQDKLTVAKGKLAKAKARQGRIAQDAKSKNVVRTLDALTKEVAALRKERAKPAPVQMDEATILKRAAERDALVGQVSNFIGAFDHSLMTVDAVAHYAVKQLGLVAPAGQERVVLNAWMHGRKPAHQTIVTADSAGAGAGLDGLWKKQSEGK